MDQEYFVKSKVALALYMDISVEEERRFFNTFFLECTD